MLSADGVTVRAFVLCCVACCWCCSCWFALLSAVGVRMARTGFKRIDIYLYTDVVARDCGAFSCLCGRAGDGVVCMDVSRFISCGVGVVVYICIYPFI